MKLVAVCATDGGNNNLQNLYTAPSTPASQASKIFINLPKLALINNKRKIVGWLRKIPGIGNKMADFFNANQQFFFYYLLKNLLLIYLNIYF